MNYRVHISLPVSNIDESIAFYQHLFGTGPTKVRDDYANFRLSEPPIFLALNLNPDEAKSGATRSHFGLELDDHTVLSSWTDRLTAAKRPIREENDVGCCYARADKTWAADPDGHAWELWVRTGEDYDQLAPSTGCCEATAVSAEATEKKSGCCG